MPSSLSFIVLSSWDWFVDSVRAGRFSRGGRARRHRHLAVGRRGRGVVLLAATIPTLGLRPWCGRADPRPHPGFARGCDRRAPGEAPPGSRTPRRSRRRRADRAHGPWLRRSCDRSSPPIPWGIPCWGRADRCGPRTLVLRGWRRWTSMCVTYPVRRTTASSSAGAADEPAASGCSHWTEAEAWAPLAGVPFPDAVVGVGLGLGVAFGALPLGGGLAAPPLAVAGAPLRRALALSVLAGLRRAGLAGGDGIRVLLVEPLRYVSLLADPEHVLHQEVPGQRGRNDEGEDAREDREDLHDHLLLRRGRVVVDGRVVLVPGRDLALLDEVGHHDDAHQDEVGERVGRSCPSGPARPSWPGRGRRPSSASSGSGPGTSWSCGPGTWARRTAGSRLTCTSARGTPGTSRSRSGPGSAAAGSRRAG